MINFVRPQIYLKRGEEIEKLDENFKKEGE